MLARHVLEHPVAFRGGEKPMGLLPVETQQLGERISRLQAHANAVRARQDRNRARHVLLIGDAHGQNDSGISRPLPAESQ